MQALRNIYTVTDRRIQIDLPESFKYSAVEVIILPVEKHFNNELSKEERVEQLLLVGTWNEEDVQPIIESKKFTNKWKIEEF